MTDCANQSKEEMETLDVPYFIQRGSNLLSYLGKSESIEVSPEILRAIRVGVVNEVEFNQVYFDECLFNVAYHCSMVFSSFVDCLNV